MQDRIQAGRLSFIPVSIFILLINKPCEKYMCKMQAYFLAAILLGVMYAISGCSEQVEMTGTYQQVSGDVPGSSSVIELEDTKNGVWQTEIDEVSFRWSVRDNEIWMHTKTGGVIIGRITDQGFVIELPEVGSFVFHRIR